MNKLLFIYNPNAGKGIVKENLSDIMDVFVRNGYIPTVYPTQKKNDGYNYIRKMEGKYELIVCSGGDGTLDEVVTGMIERKCICPLGYIPSGSTNDFARSLGISRDMIDAAEVAVNGKTFACDIGKFNGDVFVYIAAFGIFTDISYATPQDTKNVLGHMAYILEGIKLKRIYNVPAYNMKVTYNEGEVIEGRFVFGMVTNSRSVGGFKSIVGQNVVFDDGVFEVTLIRKPKNLIELQEIIAALLIEQIDSKYMISFQAYKVEFDCDQEVAWTLDGEFGGDHKIVEIENINQVLKIKTECDIM